MPQTTKRPSPPTYKHHLLSNGGFAVLALGSDWASYAYPSSVYADTAKKNPDLIGSMMAANITSGLRYAKIPAVREAWQRIRSLVEADATPKPKMSTAG